MHMLPCCLKCADRDQQLLGLLGCLVAFLIRVLAVQVANGLRIYFDKALQQLLLYAKEQDMAAKVYIHYLLLGYCKFYQP